MLSHPGNFNLTNMSVEAITTSLGEVSLKTAPTEPTNNNNIQAVVEAWGGLRDRWSCDSSRWQWSREVRVNFWPKKWARRTPLSFMINPNDGVWDVAFTNLILLGYAIEEKRKAVAALESLNQTFFRELESVVNKLRYWAREPDTSEDVAYSVWRVEREWERVGEHLEKVEEWLDDPTSRAPFIRAPDTSR